MKVRFWGVRGSCAVSGPRYRSTGGNTSCVEVEHAGHRLILDGGTGLRALGDEAGFGPLEATLLFSHVHWDHIQGVPFFGPAFNPASRLRLVGVGRRGDLRAALDAQMQPPTFPVGLDLLAGVEAIDDVAPGAAFAAGPFRVTPVEQPHPNGCAAFRIEAGDQSLVYATDVEHGGQIGIDADLIALAQGADLLIHDAQYLAEEYRGERGPSRRGWGHSTWDEAVEAARLAGARRLALFHHDPARDDAGVDAIESEARSRFAGAFAAREGTVVHLG